MRPKSVFSKITQSENISVIDDIKSKNPLLWKKLKQQFDTGRKIVNVQLHNGLDWSNENTLRYYLSEFSGRILQFGPKSLPTSFNTLEPFFVFNPHNSVLQLHSEEESYGVSLLDFLDFVTSHDFDLKKIDFFDNIPEKLIYHFSFTTGFDEINFSNNGKTFVIGGLSLVRTGNEVALLMQAGESFNQQDAEEYFKEYHKNHLPHSISPLKKSLGMDFNISDEPKVVLFDGRTDLWSHNVAMLFDLTSKTVDLRFVARDENISFKLITDDFYAIFGRNAQHTNDKINKTYETHLQSLRNYEAVFDFGKYCLALPFYVFENEKRIVDVAYETKLSSIIRNPVTKREYATVPVEYKIFAKPFYYLESNEISVIENNELTDETFKIEKTGYWKRLDINEEGFDKNGKKILGKTWVERNDVYYSTPKGATKVEKVEIFQTENAGNIYIMRQPTNEENIFKIGLTKKSVDQRKKQLSNTSAVDKFYVIHSYHTKDCIAAEKQIHKQLENFRITSRREFFRCDLKLIMSTCEKIISQINKID
jgi:hypothetical protein